MHENLTVEEHALAGCWISVRTVEMIKGLHSSEEENAYNSIYLNQNNMCRSRGAILKKNEIGKTHAKVFRAWWSWPFLGYIHLLKKSSM